MHTVTQEELYPRAGETVYDTVARLRGMGVRVPTRAMIKTPEQIEGCREAGRVNSLVLDAVAREIAVGMSTEEIDRIVMRETRALGGRPACLGFEGFPKSVCTSVNRVVCHGIPSSDCILREGDIINVDCTTVYNGYYGDASRLFTFGTLSPVAERLVRVTQEATDGACRLVRPYETHLGDIGHFISGMARRNGFSVVRDIGGHGVGLQMHEDPFVCHVGLPGQGMLLVPGMIFTIEPMINAGSQRWYVDPHDGWTVYTADGKLSAQVEHEILVTETGCEWLSA